MVGPIFTIWLISAVACGLFSRAIAESKGLDTTSWFVAGFFLGVFGLFAVGFMENSESQGRIRAFLGKPDKEFAKCKFCKEVINRQASVCHFCGDVKQL